MSLTTEIKEFALALGYSAVGIAPAEEFTQHQKTMAERSQNYSWFLNRPSAPAEWFNPKAKVPFAKSIIVLVFDYAQYSFPDNLCKIMGRTYQSRSYNAPDTTINGGRYLLFQDFLKTKGIQFENAPLLPQRWAGALAGVTTFGKNNCAYADGIGSFLIINTLLVDAELQYDQPSLDSKCPESCTLCIDACPTKALIEPYHLDSKRCLAFNNWLTTEAIGFGPTQAIPLEIRPLIGQHVHGCDICQEVCPRNQPRLKAQLPSDIFLETIAPDLTLENLLHMPESFYEQRVYPVMYNYIRDTAIFQRNAAIAMANSGDRQYISHLIAELNNPSLTVRAHVAWSLGQLGGAEALAALKEQLLVEDNELVSQEIELALAAINEA